MKIDPATKSFLGQVELGLDAQQFFRSNVGQFILKRCQEIVLASFHKLKNTDPSKIEEIRQLQSDIKRAEIFPQWFGELIAAGKEAEKYIDNRDKGDIDE